MTRDPRDQRTQTICLLILAFVALGFALYFLRPVLVPFVLALFVSFILTPVVDWPVHRWNVPQPLALVGATLLGVAGLGGVGLLVSASVAEVVANQEEYKKQLEHLTGRATGLLEKVMPTVRRLTGTDLTGSELAEVVLDLDGEAEGETTEAASTPEPAPPPDEVLQIPDAPAGGARPAVPESLLAPLRRRLVESVGPVLGSVSDALGVLLSQGFLVMIFVLYLVTGRKPRSRPPDADDFWADVELRVKKYLAVKTGVSALTGVAVFAVLSLLGVDLALVFGVFTFLLNFIPNIGSIVAVALPLPILVVSDLSLTAKILAIALPLTIQMVVGNWVEPRWLGSSLQLHPMTVLLALVFWGMLWGFVGMLLSVPMTAVMRILLERNKQTRPLAELLSGRLSPT